MKLNGSLITFLLFMFTVVGGKNKKLKLAHNATEANVV